MKHPKKLAPVAMLGAIALTVAACSSGTSPSAGSNGGPVGSGLDGRGPITYVQGKDNSNVVAPLVAKWNAAHPTEKVTFKEQTDQADQQHDDLVQNFQAQNANYDVMSVDVIWTAEFAAKGWFTLLLEVTGKPALLPALILLVVVMAIWGMLRLRRTLPARRRQR